ncbi:hypothetical protein Csac_0758 [Caldicellulosiruptor saccharolyticus DSM 8903]|uniref:Uncharacterized protein n=1 Tax=Caldicellulosiruptor saccharolyticus (strain ATCC 43494 / DSM 8903 / Tp8T 6331) TaxID=351627 RepID=A4XHJ2_CALS8|nr:MULTISPECIES: hypothetical protein [Caldicellulosiruptor]ABP66377.1 hypothetical protein Csac_0758 [Caldicellulosiruptor saccharolyticus DSM 8903]
MRKFKVIIGIVLIAALVLSVSLAFAGGSKAAKPTILKASLTKLWFGKQGKGCGVDLNISSTIESILGMKKEDIQKQIQSGKTFLDILKEKGLTLEQFKVKLLDALYAKIDEAVKSGKITTDRANLLKQNIKQKLDSWDGKTPFFGFKDKAFGRGFLGLDMMSDIASVLGMTKDELLNELKNGKTLQDILKAKNISEQDFKNKLIAMETAKIDKLLSDGKITKDQADKMKEAIKTKITNWDLSKRFGFKGFRGFKKGSCMGFGKMHGFWGKFRGFGSGQIPGQNNSTNSSATNLTF